MLGTKSGFEVFKPYLIRAVYDWCVDNANTPHLVARARSGMLADMADENGVVVLNISPAAVRDLKIDPKGVAFTARFRGAVHNVVLPHEDVMMVYGKESAHRLSFLPDAPNEAERQTNAIQRAEKKRKGLPDIKAY